jgi:hypothetical protein
MQLRGSALWRMSGQHAELTGVDATGCRRAVSKAITIISG